MIKKYWLHFKLIMKHKYYVFMEMKDYGMIWRGVMHDMSKFSPAEFGVAKFYIGTGSAITVEKKQNGFSPAWLHHIHRNKHHWEYWFDPSVGKIAPIPDKYLKEMVCDIIAASKVYNGKNYRPQMPIDYVNKNHSYPAEFKELILPLLVQRLETKAKK